MLMSLSNTSNIIIGGGINTAKEFIAHNFADEKNIPRENIIHGDRLRRELYDGLSPRDKEKFFPKMHQVFNGMRGIDWINMYGTDAYLEEEFKESEFVYLEKLQPLIEKISNNASNIIVGVQILPELLINDIASKEDSTGVIFALRLHPESLRNREEEYRLLNHNHDTYVYTYMNTNVDISTLPESDRAKLDELSQTLRIPISQYLLHLLAKLEYNKAIYNKIIQSGFDESSQILDTSTI